MNNFHHTFEKEKKGKELVVCILLKAESKLVASSPYLLLKEFYKYYSTEKIIIFANYFGQNNQQIDLEDKNIKNEQNLDEIDDIDQLMNMVSSEEEEGRSNNSQTRPNTNIFISKYENIKKLFSSFLNQNSFENFTHFIEHEMENNSSLFLMDDSNQIFQSINSESQVSDFKFVYRYGKLINKKKEKSPNIFELNLSAKIFSSQISNIVGGWNFLKNSHLPDTSETSFDENDVENDSPDLPSIFLNFNLNFFSFPDLKEFLFSLERNLFYSFSKTMIWIDVDLSFYQINSTLFDDFKNHFLNLNSKFEFNFVRKDFSNYRSSFTDSLIYSFQNKFDFYFTSFSLLNDPLLLLKLVNINKELVSPLLYNQFGRTNFWSNFTENQRTYSYCQSTTSNFFFF